MAIASNPHRSAGLQRQPAILLGLVLLFASAMVGLNEDEHAWAGFNGCATTPCAPSEEVVTTTLEKAILWIFLAEVVVKLIGEGLRPWRFFGSAWNVFDFLIVAAGFAGDAGAFGEDVKAYPSTSKLERRGVGCSRC